MQLLLITCSVPVRVQRVFSSCYCSLRSTVNGGKRTKKSCVPFSLRCSSTTANTRKTQTAWALTGIARSPEQWLLSRAVISPLLPLRFDCAPVASAPLQTNTRERCGHRQEVQTTAFSSTRKVHCTALQSRGVLNTIRIIRIVCGTHSNFELFRCFYS